MLRYVCMTLMLTSVWLANSVTAFRAMGDLLSVLRGTEVCSCFSMRCVAAYAPWTPMLAPVDSDSVVMASTACNPDSKLALARVPHLKFANCYAQIRSVPKRLKKSNVKFAGTWEVAYKKEWAFGITLKQTGMKLTGDHSLVWDNGNRIDSSFDDDSGHPIPSISGRVHGNQATVTFTSGRNPDSGGVAVITLVGNRLIWRKIKSHGDENFPVRATLTRSK